MAKTLEQLEAALAEIKAVCDKHGILLVGTCEAESIYGEISIFEIGTPSGDWRDVEHQITNEIENGTTGDDIFANQNVPSVLGIGSVTPVPVASVEDKILGYKQFGHGMTLKQLKELIKD
jgi:hypothetical protein